MSNKTSDHLHERNAADLNLFVRRLSHVSTSDVPSGCVRGPFTLPHLKGGVALRVGKVSRSLRSYSCRHRGKLTVENPWSLGAACLYNTFRCSNRMRGIWPCASYPVLMALDYEVLLSWDTRVQSHTHRTHSGSRSRTSYTQNRFTSHPSSISLWLRS
jgi:hypothetical protein